MGNKKIYIEDVERIVNDPERLKRLNEFHYAREERKQKKLLEIASLYVSVSAIFGLFGLFGWMSVWVAYFVMGVCAFCGSFYAGRLLENAKIKGWK